MKFITLPTYPMQHSAHGDISGLTFEADKQMGNELFFGVLYIPHDTGFLPVRMSILIQNLRPA